MDTRTYIQKYGVNAYRQLYREAYREAHASVASGQSQHTRQALPDQAHNDVIMGELTVLELFKAGAIEGRPDDYNLTVYTPLQLGDLASLTESPVNWAELATETPSGDGYSKPGGQPLDTSIKPEKQGGKLVIPDYAKADILSNHWTLADLIASGILPGPVTDYDVTSLTPDQLGVLTIAERQALKI